MSTSTTASRNGKPRPRPRPAREDAAPPHDEQAEKQVVWNAVLRPELLDSEFGEIRSGDFYDERHQILWGCLLEMQQEAIPIGQDPLTRYLGEKGLLEKVGGRAYLLQLKHDVPVAGHGIYYAAIVEKCAIRRGLIDVGREMVRAATTGEDPACIVAQFDQARAELREKMDGTEPAPSQFHVYSMAALDALDLRVDVVIDRALMTGAPGVDGGTFKVLKTSFALEQALSMAIGPGAHWLDHFAVLRKATSVYFAGEGGLVPIRDTLRRQCDHKGVLLRDVEALFLCDDVPRLDSTADVERAAAILRERKADFAYFDPAYLMMGAQAANASNVYAMGAMLGRMLQACREAGATPKILHHFNRAKGTAPNDAPDLADLSQAGCAEIAGQWGLIGRTKPYDAEHPGEHDLVLSIGSRIGFSSKWALHVSEGTPDSPGGRYWRPEVTPFAESKERDQERRAAKREEQTRAKEQQDLDAARRAIVAVMVRQQQPAGRAAMQERTPIQKARFGRAWASLVDDGTIKEAGSERKTNGHSSLIYIVESTTDVG